MVALERREISHISHWSAPRKEGRLTPMPRLREMQQLIDNHCLALKVNRTPPRRRPTTGNGTPFSLTCPS